MAEFSRSSLSVTLSVWKALLLREALTRVSGGRAPWAWLVLEPVVHIFFLAFVMLVVRQRLVAGIDTLSWIVSGLLGFFLFRRTAFQCANAISGNSALFSYRQVHPVDTVIVRFVLEGALMILIACAVYLGVVLAGLGSLPGDPLLVVASAFLLWVFGLGVGLAMSVGIELIPEVDHLFKFAMTPLYLVSGVVFPIALVPQPYRDWLLLNPIAHGLEGLRLGISPYYHVVPGLSLEYLFYLSMCSVFFGLALHRKFAKRLVAL
ncbi:MAG TPA: ABC transporter permease [Rhodocyclaceae bacterium]|nr:ABC transporter permease [Rhodocyclaceae bacterium]HNM80017.1 ABC transporter permease [Rhodocyclaceae bacterium]